MKSILLTCSLLCFWNLLLPVGSVVSAMENNRDRDVIISQQWQGELPVTAISLLPLGQRESATGYINDPAIFARVWQAFAYDRGRTAAPDKPVPQIDFSVELILFQRNTQFYNNIRIFQVHLQQGVVRLIAMETMSSRPIEEEVSMAMVAVPKEGISAVQGEKNIFQLSEQLTEQSPDSDPLNTNYILEGQKITLVNGQSETPAAPGSAAMNRTFVLNKPVFGDLNNDKTLDAALFLVHSSGGSGTFYYISAAKKIGEKWQGSNAIFLGDRITPRLIDIQENTILVNYTDRPWGAAMTATPSVDHSRKFTFYNDKLREVLPIDLKDPSH